MSPPLIGTFQQMQANRSRAAAAEARARLRPGPPPHLQAPRRQKVKRLEAEAPDLLLRAAQAALRRGDIP
jgi:hypothetical protein